MKLFASVVSQLSGRAGGDDLFPKHSPLFIPLQAPPAERRIGCACMNLYRIVPY